MKDRIVLFIIGVLVGTVISTGVFYVYLTTNNSSNSNAPSIQANNSQPPQIPSGENGQPPERSSEKNNQTDSNTEQTSV